MIQNIFSGAVVVIDVTVVVSTQTYCFPFTVQTSVTAIKMLNFMGHVAGTKSPPNWCYLFIKVSPHTRGHVAATYPWDIYPQHFHVCAHVVILSLLHIPATLPCYMSPQCALHDKFFVAAAGRCNVSLQHDPSCLSTLRFKRKRIPPIIRDVIDWKKCNQGEFREAAALTPWHACNVFDNIDDNYWIAETLYKNITVPEIF